MSAFKDPRSGLWRYRARVRLLDGTKTRIGGPPRGLRTKVQAEAAERGHVFRLQNPGAVAPIDPGRKVPSVEEFSKVYMSGHAADHRPREQEEKQRHLDRHILPVVGVLRLDEIRQTTVDALRAQLATGRDPKTVDNMMSVFSGLMRYAVQNRIVDRQDLRFVRGKPSVCSVDAVPMAGVEALLAIADERYRTAILLAAHAGLRNGEIRGLRWSSVNQIARRIVVERALDTKNRETLPKHDRIRAVPMTDAVWSALKALPQRGDHVITRLRGGLPLSYWASREAIQALYDKAKVATPEQPWHGLRHTFGTELARSGTPVNTIKALMGHADIKTTLRYMHSDDSDQRLALGRTFG